MNIVVNGRQIEVTPSLRSYAEEKIGKFERYLSNITEATVTLSVQKYRHKAEVLLKANGVLIQAEGVTGEIHSAIDEVALKLERQVKKFKEKMVSHRRGQMAETVSPGPVLGTIPKIIKRKRFEMKPMSLEEAAMQMEFLDKDFFIFTNDKSGDINVLYKRNDGNLGLIEPVK